MSDRITIPEHPRQGDVVTWWTMTLNPGGAYVQRHRATYYADATCVDVLGKDYARGKAFHDEWLIESWYEPSGSKTAGGRNTTSTLRDYFRKSPLDVYVTWGAARIAAVAATRQAAIEHKKTATRLELVANGLAEAATPPETQ